MAKGANSARPKYKNATITPVAMIHIPVFVAVSTARSPIKTFADTLTGHARLVNKKPASDPKLTAPLDRNKTRHERPTPLANAFSQHL